MKILHLIVSVPSVNAELSIKIIEGNTRIKCETYVLRDLEMVIVQGVENKLIFSKFFKWKTSFQQKSNYVVMITSVRWHLYMHTHSSIQTLQLLFNLNWIVLCRIHSSKDSLFVMGYSIKFYNSGKSIRKKLHMRYGNTYLIIWSRGLKISNI